MITILCPDDRWGQSRGSREPLFWPRDLRLWFRDTLYCDSRLTPAAARLVLTTWRRRDGVDG